jgi:hypothetical protein
MSKDNSDAEDMDALDRGRWLKQEYRFENMSEGTRVPREHHVWRCKEGHGLSYVIYDYDDLKDERFLCLVARPCCDWIVRRGLMFMATVGLEVCGAPMVHTRAMRDADTGEWGPHLTYRGRATVTP